MAVTERELLAAIHAEPQIDEHRRVYADWLAERGDPRGEFIHLQLAAGDGHVTEDARARMRALVRAHAKAWLGPLDRVLDRNSVMFERGFAVAARCKPGLRKPEQFFAEPGWATFEHLDDPPIALLWQSSPSSLRSVGLHRDQARLLRRDPRPLPMLELLEVRASKGTGAVVFFDEQQHYRRGPSLPSLIGVRFVHFQIGLPASWRALIDGGLQALALHADHRGAARSAGHWAQWLRSSSTTLEQLTLGDPDLEVTLDRADGWTRATLRLLAASPSAEQVQAELDKLTAHDLTATLDVSARPAGAATMPPLRRRFRTSDTGTSVG